MPESPICAPVAVGGPSSYPVVLIDPPMACATTSYAFKLVYGPSPKPLIEAKMSRGFSSWRRSQVKPSRSIVPGPKFSTSTSERFTNSVKIRLPSSALRLRVMLFLLPLSIVK